MTTTTATATTATRAGTSRRPRIVYELTAAGQAEFTARVGDVGPAAWDDDGFDVRFVFFGATDLESRLRILEGRRARLQERLERVQRRLERTQRQLDRYATELQRHGVESVEREVRWLSELIDAERGATAVPAPPTRRAPRRRTTSTHTHH